MIKNSAQICLGVALVVITAGCAGETATESGGATTDTTAASQQAGGDGSAPAYPAGSGQTSAPAANYGSGAPTGTTAGNLAPASAPRPAPVQLYALESGAQLQVTLDHDITSDTALVGDKVTARLMAPARANGKTLLPAGTVVEGSITEVKPAKRFGGQAMVAVGFDSVRLPSGRIASVEGNMSAFAKKQTGKDAGTIAGGTAGGALLGKVLGGEDKDAGLGAVVGGAVGTAIASRRGDEALLPAGSEGVIFTRERITSTAAL